MTRHSVLSALAAVSLLLAMVWQPRWAAGAEPPALHTRTHPLGASLGAPLGVPMTAPLFGVTTRDEWNDANARNLAVAAGVRWARTSVDWSALEPTQGNINLTSLDGRFAEFQRLGIIPLVYVTSNPGWAATTSCGPIDKVPLTAFGNFMQALAGRYNGTTVVNGVTLPRVDYWALYNEPDNRWPQYAGFGGCWGDHGQAYAQLLAVAWDAVHTANPNGQLGMGGIAAEPNVLCSEPGCNGQQMFNTNVVLGQDNSTPIPGQPADFVDDVLDYVVAHPGATYFDFFDFHSYPAFANNWDAVPPYNSAFAGKARHYGLRLQSRGLSRYLISSEAGRPSAAFKDYFGVPGSNEEQSRYVVRLYAQAMRAGMHAVTWFSYGDFDSALWGLLNAANQPKPSYAAYRTLTEQLGAATFVAKPALPNAELYIFTVPGVGYRSVVWASDTASSAAVTFAAGAIYTMDKWGMPTVYHDGQAGDQDGAVNGSIVLTVTGSPIYVDGRPDATPTNTATATGAATATRTGTATAAASSTRTSTVTATTSATRTGTATTTASSTHTATATVTGAATTSATASPSPTRSVTATPTTTAWPRKIFLPLALQRQGQGAPRSQAWDTLAAWWARLRP